MLLILSHLAIDYASLWRRRTIPTPNRERLQPLGAQYVFFRILHRNVFIISSPSCFAICDTIYLRGWRSFFSLLSSVPNSPVSHSSVFIISSNASRSSFYISHSHIVLRYNLYCFSTRAHLCIFLPSSRLLVYLFLLSGRSRSPTRIVFSAFLRSPIVGRCKYVFIPMSCLIPPVYTEVFLLFHYIFLSASISLFLSFLLHLSRTPQTFLWTVSLLGASYIRPYSLDYAIPPYSSSFFGYFLPYGPISFDGWQPLFWHVSYFILPCQLSHVSTSIRFKWVHSLLHSEYGIICRT